VWAAPQQVTTLRVARGGAGAAHARYSWTIGGSARPDETTGSPRTRKRPTVLGGGPVGRLDALCGLGATTRYPREANSKRRRCLSALAPDGGQHRCSNPTLRRGDPAPLPAPFQFVNAWPRRSQVRIILSVQDCWSGCFATAEPLASGVRLHPVEVHTVLAKLPSHQASLRAGAHGVVTSSASHTVETLSACGVSRCHRTPLSGAVHLTRAPLKRAPLKRAPPGSRTLNQRVKSPLLYH
jgi:hypothetical protein